MDEFSLYMGQGEQKLAKIEFSKSDDKGPSLRLIVALDGTQHTLSAPLDYRAIANLHLFTTELIINHYIEAEGRGYHVIQGLFEDPPADADIIPFKKD